MMEVHAKATTPARTRIKAVKISFLILLSLLKIM